MKKTALVLLALLVVMLSASCALADTPPASEISADLSSAFTSWQNPMRSSDFTITYVDAGISVSGNILYLAATTESNMVAIDIGGFGQIQRWENNAWQDYMQIGFTAIDSDIATLSRTVVVVGGYYYRMVLTHTATIEHLTQYCTTTTRSVYVN